MELNLPRRRRHCPEIITAHSSLGARAGSLYRKLVAHTSNLGVPGDRAPARQQPCIYGAYFIALGVCFIIYSVLCSLYAVLCSFSSHFFACGAFFIIRGT